MPHRLNISSLWCAHTTVYLVNDNIDGKLSKVFVASLLFDRFIPLVTFYTSNQKLIRHFVTHPAASSLKKEPLIDH